MTENVLRRQICVESEFSVADTLSMNTANTNLTEVERAVLLLGVHGCRLPGEYDESPEDDGEPCSHCGEYVVCLEGCSLAEVAS